MIVKEQGVQIFGQGVNGAKLEGEEVLPRGNLCIIQLQISDYGNIIA